MKVIKNINNNVSLCLDSNNVEVVAFGKGIGFTKPPYEINLSKVERTYYNVDSMYVNMINDIPREIFGIADKAVNYARIKVNYPISSNIVFTLADHLNFAINRYKSNMVIKMPIVNDIQYLCEHEMEVGEYTLALIKKEMNIALPEEEACYIALHIINAEAMEKNKELHTDEDIIREIIKIIEKEFHIKIDKKGYNYSRFVSHMNYLLKRGKNNDLIKSDNRKLYESLIHTYSDTHRCCEIIRKYLNEKLDLKMSDEECLYLILHINRLCAREDCYQ